MLYMPRREKLIALRLSTPGLARIDRRAAEAGVTRSEMMRRMLAWADKAMPR